MIRTTLVSTVLVATLLAPASALAQVTAADVASFVGDWTLAMQGPNGPGTFNLSVKVEDDKVVGEIGSDALPTQKVTSISKTDKSLVCELLLSMGGQFDRRGRIDDAGRRREGGRADRLRRRRLHDDRDRDQEGKGKVIAPLQASSLP